jgi:hypothetical protein
MYFPMLGKGEDERRRGGQGLLTSIIVTKTHIHISVENNKRPRKKLERIS